MKHFAIAFNIGKRALFLLLNKRTFFFILLKKRFRPHIMVLVAKLSALFIQKIQVQNWIWVYRACRTRDCIYRFSLQLKALKKFYLCTAQFLLFWWKFLQQLRHSNNSYDIPKCYFYFFEVFSIIGLRNMDTWWFQTFL